MAENSFIRVLKLIWRTFKAFFTSKNALSFLFFLFLSFCFWFFNALNKERETNLHIPVRYVGLSQELIIKNNPPAVISATISEEGLRLFSYRRRNITALLLDLSHNTNEKERILIDRQQIYNSLSTSLLPTSTIVKFNPDSIVIELQQLYTKVLPVELVAEIKPASQHYITSEIRVIPDSVVVSGKEELIQNLKSVKTKAFVLNEIDKNLSAKNGLETNDSLRYSTDEVSIEIDVERFTEKHLKLPVTVINAPANVQVIIFPTNVELTYNVGISNFNSVNEDSIKVFFDYQTLSQQQDGRKKLDLKIDTKNIFNVRIHPDEVEFLLETK